LPYGRRVNALAGCVQLYRPLGYLATFGYLKHVAGPLRRDEAALLRALDALTASRERWLAEVDAYAGRRRDAKQRGRRNPGSAESNPHPPACWYGDSRRAATFTLIFLLNRHEHVAHAESDVLGLASAVINAQGDVNPASREQVDELRERLERLRQASAWPDVDWENWHKANQSLWILHQISYATA
jgi:hypothetical protein